MPTTSINDLPVELHTSILKCLLSLSRIPSLLPCENHVLHVESDLSLSPVEFEWTQKDIRSPSLFPFNVASASKLWRDILALIPECWTRVAFDVAKDPTPLLNVFLWSKDLKDIEVVVFNSDVTEIVGEIRERSFVLAIAEALRPHIHRCKSITFDVTYVTSLPSPTMFFIHGAPYLEKLSLDCRIENPNLPPNEMKIGRQQDFATSFPALKELSLTGFWFMYLVLHASKPDWLDHLSSEFSLPLCISHFTFPRYGQYSLPEFVSFISKAAMDSVHYRNLSLAYTYDDSEPKPDFTHIISSDSHFRTVSKDFIAHLYATADFCSNHSLSFTACEIPELKMNQFGYYLKLTNIIDNDESRSLRHILKVWAGGELTIDSCPSFNDTLLSWLTLSNTVPAKYPTFLRIFNCGNFSSRVLREFLHVHSYASFAARLGGINLFVRGRHPVLSDEDRRWFTQNAQKMGVHWKAIDDQGKIDLFKVSIRYN